MKKTILMHLLFIVLCCFMLKVCEDNFF